MEAIRQTLRGWRRGAAWFAIAAIVFHAALLLVHRPVQAGEGETRDGTVVLCTAFGMKVVALADLTDPPPAGEAPEQSSIYYCPICLGAQLSAVALVPDAFVLLSVAQHAAAPLAAPHDIVAVAAFCFGTLGSRAPPSFV